MSTTITQGQDLLRQIADAIEAQPERHEQAAWQDTGEECGTTACIAGWACILGTGDFFVQGKHYVPRKDAVRRELKRYHARYPHSYRTLQQALRIHADGEVNDRVDGLANTDYYLETGARLLGLEREDSWALFETDNGPLGDHTVPSALRAIADGTPVEDVWGPEDDED